LIVFSISMMGSFSTVTGFNNPGNTVDGIVSV
jgi:hypothetical protein